MKIKSLKEAERYFLSYLPTSPKYTFTGALGLKRTKYLLKLLGNPQNKIKTIHIAGTSGKGSTAYFISSLLHAHGFRVGLHLSPHLLDIRERMEVNNAFLFEDVFVKYTNEIIPFVEKMKNSQFGTPTYFEVLTALAFYTFYRERVDYAVIETGLGGLYDATNAIGARRKAEVLTRIGLDHTKILGNTISKIAFQKAGIIRPHTIVVSAQQLPAAQRVINSVAKKNDSSVFYVKRDKNIKNIVTSADQTRFDFSFDTIALAGIRLGAIGEYQAENAGVALATLAALSKRDNFSLDENKIKTALRAAHFAGRFDVKKIKGKTVILDGAHNPQKMSSFIKSLKKVYPGKKFHFLISFKKGKDYPDILKHITPVATKITITDFYVANQDLTHISEEPHVIQKHLQKLGYKNIEITKNPKLAFQKVLAQNDDVITGSLYFLSVIYPLLPKI